MSVCVYIYKIVCLVIRVVNTLDFTKVRYFFNLTSAVVIKLQLPCNLKMHVIEYNYSYIGRKTSLFF